MKVICLISDLVKSRDIKDREKLQQTLKKKLTAINALSKVNLVSPYTITLGDEFQAVYRNYESLFNDIAAIIRAVYPCRLRFSISYGSLATKLNTKESIGMDGPVFHSAREQLNTLKKFDKTIIAVHTAEVADIEIINQSLLMFAHEFERWNKTAVSSFVNLLNGKTIKDIVRDADVKERMVYKAISGNHIRDYADYFAMLKKILEKTVS
jgi:hypothetical protein